MLIKKFKFFAFISGQLQRIQILIACFYLFLLYFFEKYKFKILLGNYKKNQDRFCLDSFFLSLIILKNISQKKVKKIQCTDSNKSFFNNYSKFLL